MWFIDLLKRLTQIINSAEDTVITFVSVVVPWLVPVVPAYLTYNHVHNPTELNFPVWVSFTVGIVVEALGLSSMYTTFQFANHNRRYKDSKNHSPVWIAIATYVFYLATILIVNVVLDVQNNLNTGHIWAIALLSLLSVPAGVLISVRAQHTELVQNLKHVKPSVYHIQEEQKNEKVELPEKVYASSKRQEILDILESTYLTEHRIPGGKEISNILGLDAHTSKGYISSLTKEWSKDRT